MKNLMLALLAALFLSNPAFASVGWKANGTPHGAMENFNATCATGADCSTQTGVTRKIPILDSTLFASGTANGGATSVASTTAACPIGYAFVRKIITSNSDPAFTAGTLADGKPGQVLTIRVIGISPSAAQTGGNYTLTPTTTTGFTSIKFTAVGDYAVLTFQDSTTGWTLGPAGGTITITYKN